MPFVETKGPLATAGTPGVAAVYTSCMLNAPSELLAPTIKYTAPLPSSRSIVSIAVALDDDIQLQRPFTHDLFRNFSERFEIHVKRVIIQKLVDGVFYSSLICERDQIEEIIDSRTSDAISLALRFNAPIFAHESVLEKAAVMIDDKDLDKDSEDNSKNTDDLQQLSVDELEKLIQKALKKEEYELAVKIRDEIAKRESKP